MARKIIKGSKDRPRLSVFKSNYHIYAQIIDDEVGATLAAASSLKLEDGGNVEAAAKVGKLIADAAKTKSIKSIVFDRKNYPYKGRIKALADAARENGLVF